MVGGGTLIARLLLGSIIVSVFATVGCSGGTPDTTDDPDVLAAFQGGEIRRAEFDAFVLPEVQQDEQVAEVDAEDWRLRKIKALAFRKLVEAVPVLPEVEARVQATVKSAVATQFQTLMTEELGWNEIEVTREEARTQYDDNPQQYFSPKRFQIQYIYLRAAIDEMSDEERAVVRERLEGIREEILAGADFAQMARKYSESSTASAGGAYTLSVEADAHPEFLDAVRKLEIGEVSEVVDTPTGFIIAVLNHVIEPIDRQFDDVIEFANRRARLQKLKKLQDEFVAEVGQRYGLVKHYERLEDPHTPQDASLITIGETEYTLAKLTEALPEHLVVQLYTGYLPAVKEFLDKVALNSLLELEGDRLGLAERPEIKTQIDNAAREARFEEVRLAMLRERANEIPESELREFYEQNRDRYQTLKTMDVDVILLHQAPDEATLWDTQKRAEALVKELRDGRDFAEAARTLSRHYSASSGGRMEHLTSYGVGRLLQPRPAFSGMLNRLEEGEISDPWIAECYITDELRFQQVGVMIVRLAKRYPPEQASFETMKDRVRNQYVRRNFTRLENELRDEMLEDADLKVYVDNMPPV
jgi:parvulin-like peptidyl-prolyl isomerase